MKKHLLFILFVLSAVPLLTGFDYSKHNIPLDEIHSGGPPKDGIPALTDPVFIAVDEAEFLNNNDRVLGISVDGEAKAYPIRLLNWHEIVNDRLGGQDILVSYCPLCGTGMVFDARLDGKRFLFGVSGKLYNSDVLMYDKQTESLWSQIGMEAVTGPMTGQELTLLPAEHTTWEDWRAKHPDTKVLSLKTGYRRDYFRNPYQGYEKNPQTYFPVNHNDRTLPFKEWVAGVEINGEAKAYPFSKLAQDGPVVEDTLAGRKITVLFNKNYQSAVVKDSEGKAIPSVQAYWFAWRAFYPETEIYQ